MPLITFHGGKLNNRKKFIERLSQQYVYEYIKSNVQRHDLLDLNPVDNSDVYFHRMREVYVLTKVSRQIDNRCITKMGYVKEGSKTKPETVWNKGLFHSQYEYVDLCGIGYWK